MELSSNSEKKAFSGFHGCPCRLFFLSLSRVWGGPHRVPTAASCPRRGLCNFPVPFWSGVSMRCTQSADKKGRAGVCARRPQCSLFTGRSSGALWALLAACISRAYLSMLLSLKHDISLCHHSLKYSCVKEVVQSTCEFLVCFQAHCGLV